MSVMCSQYTEASGKLGRVQETSEERGLTLAPAAAVVPAEADAEAQARPRSKAAAVLNERGIGVVVKAKTGGVDLWVFWGSGRLWPLF